MKSYGILSDFIQPLHKFGRKRGEIITSPLEVQIRMLSRLLRWMVIVPIILLHKFPILLFWLVFISKGSTYITNSQIPVLKFCAWIQLCLINVKDYILQDSTLTGTDVPWATNNQVTIFIFRTSDLLIFTFRILFFWNKMHVSIRKIKTSIIIFSQRCILMIRSKSQQCLTWSSITKLIPNGCTRQFPPVYMENLQSDEHGAINIVQSRREGVDNQQQVITEKHGTIMIIYIYM